MTHFNYDSLPATDRTLLLSAAQQIRAQNKNRAAAVIRIGQALADAKARGTLDKTCWKAWLKLEFHWSPKTAENYIRVAKKFANLENLQQYSVAALYFLARESTPATAIQQAQQLAASCQHITLPIAKQLAGHNSATQNIPTDAEESEFCTPTSPPRRRRNLRQYVLRLAAGTERRQLALQILNIARELSNTRGRVPRR